MFFLLRHIWNKVSASGTNYTHNERERKDVVLLNRALLIFAIVQVWCLANHIINGSTRSAVLTGIFIAGIAGIHLLIRNGHANIAKITSIALVNYNTVALAIFLGPDTHIIDFLMLSALMPLYFFESRNKKLIFGGVALSIIPFALYQYVAPYFASYALPLQEQIAVYNGSMLSKVLTLSVLIYLIYHKNAAYEKEAQNKELQIVDQKRLYERILEQIPIDIVTFDRDLRYTYVNSTAVKDPVVREWLIGKTNIDYFKERNLDLKGAADRDRMLHEALGQQKAVQIEESLVDRHGKSKHTVKGAAPIYGDNKEVLCVIGYSLDITDMKEAERKLKEYAIELERKNADLHNFVNATSHDLKTPLRNITSYLQLIERKNRGKLDDDSLSMIAYTVKSVKHLNQLISDIYQYSVADQNDKPVHMIELTAVLEDSLQPMGDLIEQKNALIQFSDLPQVKVAPSHIGLIFSNLVSNAIKYNTCLQPKISIGCEVKDDEYIINVTDNGIGIAPEYQKQIFEIFRRLHTPSEYEGTGVGLAICNKIAENYGGKIWVESAPGKGSTFFFSLAKHMVGPNSIGMRKINNYDKFAIAG